MKKVIRHFKRWNEWRKNCLNSPLYKILVLLKIIESPSFRYFWTKEDGEAFRRGFEEGLNSTTSKTLEGEDE